MKIIDRLVCNFSDRPPGTIIDTILFHDTGCGTLEGAISWWNKLESKASAHSIIDYDGKIYRCVPWDKKAWHAGESEFKGRKHVNDFSLGCELLLGKDPDRPFTEAQLDSAIEISIYWIKEFPNITVDRITGHRFVAVPKGRKVDPHHLFPWDDFKASIRYGL